MNPALVAAVPGIISGVGQIFSNSASGKEARRQREFNAAEAEKARQFSASQSATEVQRRVADLKAAGLNPALAYDQGGASAPQASTASSSAAPQMGNALGAGVSSAQAAVSLAQQLQQIQINAQNSKADIALKGAQAANVLASTEPQVSLLKNQAGESNARRALYGTQNRVAMEMLDYNKRLILAQMSSLFSSAEESKSRTKLNLFDMSRAKAESDFYSGPGKYMPYVEGGASAVGALLSSAVGLGKFARMAKGLRMPKFGRKSKGAGIQDADWEFINDPPGTSIFKRLGSGIGKLPR